MPIAQPKILYPLNAATGATIENFGTDAADAAVQVGAVENTNWRWVPGASALLSYLELLTLDNSSGGGDLQPYVNLTGYTLGTTFTHVYTAVGFRVASFDTAILNEGYLASALGGRGSPIIRIKTPSAGGDFDILCRFETTGFFLVGEHTFTGLSFGTDYRIVIAVDLTSNTAAQAKFLLDGGTVQKPATTSPGGDSWNTDAGYIDRRHDFTMYGGLTGRLYYWAHDRGVLLSDQDMLDLNADPTIITGWPAGGASGPPPLAWNRQGAMGVIAAS